MFDKLVKIKQEIGLSPDEGLEGKLRVAIHHAEIFFKKYDDLKAEALILTLRRNEKDFLIRKLPKYIDKHTRKF